MPLNISFCPRCGTNLGHQQHSFPKQQIVPKYGFHKKTGALLLGMLLLLGYFFYPVNNVSEPITMPPDITPPPPNNGNYIYLNGLQFLTALEHTLENSRIQKKPIYIHVRSESDSWSKKFEDETFVDQSIINILTKNFILVSIDVNKQTNIAKNFSVRGTPTEIFLDSNGVEIRRVPGYIDTQSFKRILNALLSNPAPTPTTSSLPKVETIKCELCHPKVSENKSHPLIGDKQCIDCHGTDIEIIHKNAIGFITSSIPSSPAITPSTSETSTVPTSTISLAAKTLAVDETWDMGEGYTLKAVSIDARANPKQVWLVLNRNGVKLDDKVLILGAEYKYFTRANNNIFGTKISNISPGATTDLVTLTDTYIVSGSIP